MQLKNKRKLKSKLCVEGIKNLIRYNKDEITEKEFHEKRDKVYKKLNKINQIK